MRACIAPMPGNCPGLNDCPGRYLIQRSLSPLWHMPAPWTAAKGAAPHLIRRTADRGQQRRSAQIAAAGLRRVDRNFRLIPLPAGDANQLTEDSGSASGSNGNGKGGIARWQLDLLFQMLSDLTNITARQNFSCCKTCAPSEVHGVADEGDVGFCCFTVSCFSGYRMSPLRCMVSNINLRDVVLCKSVSCFPGGGLFQLNGVVSAACCRSKMLIILQQTAPCTYSSAAMTGQQKPCNA